MMILDCLGDVRGSDWCKEGIVLRDCSERGRTIEGVLYQYNRFVKKAYDEYIKPTMRYANIIVPFGSDNTTAIDFIVTNLNSKL
jgi:uridine kinase